MNEPTKPARRKSQTATATPKKAPRPPSLATVKRSELRGD